MLYIEDEPALLRAMVRRLEAAHEVTAVADAHSALALLERGERFDAILCDMGLPDLSGIKLHDAIQRDWPIRGCARCTVCSCEVAAWNLHEVRRRW